MYECMFTGYSQTAELILIQILTYVLYVPGKLLVWFWFFKNLIFHVSGGSFHIQYKNDHVWYKYGSARLTTARIYLMMIQYI